jgi:hypothetical protein
MEGACKGADGRLEPRPHPGRVTFVLPARCHGCGRSSGVERNLAKVEVEGSNPFARSSLFKYLRDRWAAAVRASPLYPHKVTPGRVGGEVRFSRPSDASISSLAVTEKDGA